MAGALDHEKVLVIRRSKIEEALAGLVLAGRSAAAANNDLKWLYQKLRNEIESFEAEQVAVAYEEQTVRGIGVAIARLPVKGDSFEQIRVGDPTGRLVPAGQTRPRATTYLRS
ncbi:hypothetical protein J2W42_005701 [Rhizobium tibeticum]|uniref:hypothetical protein n=1 Tax=Rhizobium tibeticum TaxID=501024 RepID=UPI00278324B1|nr:hypothetical protein [Rhizobium tibeticum]MDP9812830.1 hypothetical protein [Rhizobium tibeticum]